MVAVLGLEWRPEFKNNTLCALSSGQPITQAILTNNHSNNNNNNNNNTNDNISITNKLQCDLTDTSTKFYALYVAAKPYLLVAGAVLPFSKLENMFFWIL